MNLQLQSLLGLVGLMSSTVLASEVVLEGAPPVEATPASHRANHAVSTIPLRFGAPSDLGVALSPVIEAPLNPVVDIAICLDTSGSMDGLIGSAKQKLWSIVNEFVFAQPMPELRVALFTYGNDGHDPEGGWVKLETGLTEDLDLVSERLFAQTTNGGTELVGRVVNAAAGQLDWSQEVDALKLVIVAGNETADQDTVVSFRQACGSAIARDIMVNAIYCGAPGDADAASWREVARLADGQFAAIDQGLGQLAIATPFDAELATLSTGLNETYLAYGAQGAWSLNNQVVQDSNAVGLNSEAAASRAFCKANGLYNCASWDLVDAVRTQSVVLADIKVEDLPEEMKVMTPEQREVHVATMQERRSSLQAQVNDISKEREAFLQAELAKQQGAQAVSLDAAIKRLVRDQARAKGYRFPSPLPAAPATSDVTPAAPAAGEAQVPASTPAQRVAPAPQIPGC